eukprot:6243039-Pyramimonas_sp.AAC.1
MIGGASNGPDLPQPLHGNLAAFPLRTYTKSPPQPHIPATHRCSGPPGDDATHDVDVVAEWRLQLQVHVRPPANREALPHQRGSRAVHV